jgi:hypothetical protein
MQSVLFEVIPLLSNHHVSLVSATAADPYTNRLGSAVGEAGIRVD